MRAMVSGLCAVVLLGFAPPTLAQPLTGLFAWQVSADGGATWSSSIAVNPGDTYRIRGVASWTDGATPSHGFGGCTFEQINLIGADSSDVFGGASGAGGVPTYLTRRQGVEAQWLLYPAANGMTIDSEPGRVSMGQLPYALAGGIPNPSYLFDNPILLLDLSAIAGGEKTLTISATWTRLDMPPTNEFRVYTLPNGINKKPLHEAVIADAVVHIIPAPASAALLALTPSLRRRRNPHHSGSNACARTSPRSSSPHSPPPRSLSR